MQVELKHDGRRILIPVLILRPFPVTDFESLNAVALLDTGSSVSGVSGKIAAELGLEELGKRPLKSAQGLGQVQRYAFRLGFQSDGAEPNRPKFPFVFEEVIGIELTSAFEFTALIGMDILQQCDFTMNRDRQCRLAFGS